MKAVVFLESAREDLRSEKNRYREIDPKLARRLHTAVEHATSAIAHYPLAMQPIEFDVRRWPVDDGFPHGILYRVDEHQIVVLSVFHPKRDPETWKGRARA